MYLKKGLTALSWCAGTPGFEKHLRVYQLLSDGSKPAGKKSDDNDPDLVIDDIRIFGQQD